MDRSPPIAPSGPKPILRRATVRRQSSDYEAYPPSPNRRQSEPAPLAQRRDSGPIRLQLPMPRRPPLLPFRSDTQRSVQFSEGSPPGIEMHMRTPGTPQTPTYPLIRTPTDAHASLFGVRTQFRPLWLLGIGNAGLTLFSIGEVLIQRAIWPVKSYQGLNPFGPTVLPGGAPGHGDAFGSRKGAVVAGCVLMAIGVGAAIGSSVLFFQDGLRLNRAQNPARPNYRRTIGYFTAHQIGIATLVAHKFIIEAYRESLPPSAAWATAIPGGLGSALFAVTQAQSFSSSELANGQMPIAYRGALSAGARAMVASYIFLGALVGTPNVSAYGREAVRMVTAVSTNLAYALPLGTARLAGPAADIPVGNERYRGDWSALQGYTVYVIARLAGTISSFWLSRSRWPVAAVSPADSPAHRPTQRAFSMAIENAFRNLPPPLPSGSPDWDETTAASILMAISFGASVYAFLQFHRDSPPPYWHGRFLVACATASVMLGLTFRAIQEHAKSHADFEEVWLATIPGFIAQALAFYAVVDLYSQSEQSRGNVPIAHRYQVIEACRFIGGLAWYLWAGQSGILNFPPIARQLTIWAATSATILGFALPNADTQRAARGATPRFEIGNPFDRH